MISPRLTSLGLGLKVGLPEFTDHLKEPPGSIMRFALGAPSPIGDFLSGTT